MSPPSILKKLLHITETREKHSSPKMDLEEQEQHQPEQKQKTTQEQKPTQEPVELPINGILDLHTFKPSDLGTLIPDYIDACLENDIFAIRIIHGKGKGVLRRSVHALLERHPAVISYTTAGDRSGWGATLAELSRLNPVVNPKT